MGYQTRRSFLKRTAASVGAAMGVASAGPSLAAVGAEDTFRPRFAICNETFGDWPLDKAFALAAECGYQGIEIAPFTIANDVTEIPPERRRQVRRQAEKAGLEVVGLHWLLARTKGLHLTSPEAEVRRRTTEYLGALAEFCADLGGTLLVFGSPQQRNVLPGVSREEAMQHAVEVLRTALPVLEKRGVSLAFEPLSPKATSFVSTAAEAVELIKMVGSPRCRLILDCNAMATEPKPMPELIRTNRSWLAHFHANDPNRQGPGFGKLDFVPIFQALGEIDYRGWVSVEVFDYSPGPERLARESIRYMQECLGKVRLS
jgi:sugar phosphate isomerase/epimerase